MLAAGIEPAGVDVKPPEFEHIARAYGYPYRRITSQTALSSALREFGERRQVVVIELPAEEFK
jgi:thiamine pyrophosphate-dependent acetolactate synthase large subunit-like protein